MTVSTPPVRAATPPDTSPEKQAWPDVLRRSVLLRRALWMCALLHFALNVGVFLPRNLARHDRDRDLVNYYLPARAVLEHQPIYQPQPGFGPDRTLFIFIYLPPFAATVAPLGWLSFHTFARVWLLLLFGAFWIYAWTLARLASATPSGARDGPQATFKAVLIAGLFVGVCPGSAAALALGQVDPLLWMLFGLGLCGFGRGVCFALAALTKPFYAWPLLLSASRTGRRVWIPALAVVVVAFLLGGLVCGFDAYRAWLRDVLPLLGQGTFNSDNVSLSMGVLRASQFFGWHYNGGPLTAWPRLWLSCASLLGPLLMWRVTRRLNAALASAWVGTAAVVCAPTCWTSYLPALLAPLALMIGKYEEKS